MILEKDENGNTISSCKDCVFAVYHQSTAWHRIQTGCKFSRVEKFRERGTCVDWVNGDAVSHHQIHTFCNTIRPKEWAIQNHTDDIDFLMWKALNDNKVRYSPIIWVSDKDFSDIEDTINGIKHTISNILTQKIPPQQIVISVNAKLDFASLISEIKDFYKQTGSLSPLFFTRVIESEYDRHIIDLAMTKVEATYYLAIKSGYKLPESFIEKVNNAINIDLKMVAIVKNNENTIMMVSTILHKTYGGNLLGESDLGPASLIEEKTLLLNGNKGIINMDELYE